MFRRFCTKSLQNGDLFAEILSAAEPACGSMVITLREAVEEG